jgi:S1-C subfamily serine protease
MSQTYDPNDSEKQAQGYPAGPGYAGGTGYPGGPGYGAGYGFATQPPPPPRKNHKRGLAITGALALAAGAAAGGLIGGLHPTSVGTATATSKTMLSTSQIASRVDPGLVDVVSTLGDEQATAAGTGIVLTSTGEILTNNHVIDGATSIKVTDVGNGRTYTAKVVGYDATQDVAVIQLQNASGLTVASLGDSSTVRTGDNVVALGNAGGKGGTPSVAAGTVTALNQSITASDEGSGNSEQLTGLIETNADIQPGDSGGSLVNAYGQVIGMDTAASSGTQVQSQSGQTAEQAFAIPINEATSIAKQIAAGTTSTNVHIGATAFLGIESQPASQGSGDSGGFGGSGGSGGSSGFGGFGGSNGSSGSSGSSGFGGFGGSDGSSGFGGFGDGQGSSVAGVAISGTLSGSPAANAGLAAGDTITSVGGQSVSTAQDISHVLVKYHPGNSISISWVDQSGQSQTANVTLASGPAA